MRPALSSMLLSLALTGCASNGDGAADGAKSLEMFAPREVRLHPVFTKIDSWQGDERPEGIEALVELRDQFGDTCKGAGSFVFELFEYRADQPDPRGKRLSNPWQASIVTPDEQRERWSKTSRCYTFRLQSDRISRRGPYVLSVSYSPVVGARAFDRIVLGSPEESAAR